MHELEHKKRCAARYVWPMREKPTPSADKAKRQHPTWREWYMRKFGEPIEAVRARCLADQQKPENRATMDFYMKAGR